MKNDVITHYNKKISAEKEETTVVCHQPRQSNRKSKFDMKPPQNLKRNRSDQEWQKTKEFTQNIAENIGKKNIGKSTNRATAANFAPSTQRSHDRRERNCFTSLQNSNSKCSRRQWTYDSVKADSDNLTENKNQQNLSCLILLPP